MKKIAYSKYSNERARQFAIRTDILVDEYKNYTVVKKNLYPEGRAHIENIYKWYESLNAIYFETGLVMNECILNDEGVSLEYLSMFTLEHELTQLLQGDNTDKFLELLFLYLDKVKSVKNKIPFKLTDAFIEVFGHEEFPEEMICSEITDIDMVLNNVILGDRWTIVDYEWTFDFPIPINFVVYRILHYLIYTSTFRQKLLSLDLMKKADISETECEIYARMELHFQTEYLLTDQSNRKVLVPIREMHDKISPGSIDLKAIYMTEKSKKENHLQVFFSEEGVFSEEKSYTVLQDIEKPGRLEVDLQKATQFFRFDPSDRPCIISELIVKDNFGNKRAIDYTNGIPVKEDQFVFLDNDPQMVFGGLKDVANLTLSFNLEFLSQEEHEMFGDMIASRRRVEEILQTKEAEIVHLEDQTNQKNAEIENYQGIIANRDQQIENMKNTKIWKAYEKFRSMFGKA
ncbi:hypothetical protein IW492_10485 [Enterococcus sp. BWB1-3]|uniref:hypothetical protein n=1 Tax=Enterococcus sp. BWB1-3 TaxID=2787713 RepID=UPI001924F9E4|nr:hypothetical protein [Enterococcus sp. BWB1-3]MBL1229656.1 hypothetical protein [Enterococcus sp. BWB1-3]